MAKWQSILSDLEKDAQLAKLPYSQQQLVRQDVLKARLIDSDQEFVALPEMYQDKVVRDILSNAPPALNNPILKAMAQDIYDDRKFGALKAGLGTFLRGFIEQNGITMASSFLLSQAAGGIEGDDSLWQTMYGQDAENLKLYMEKLSPAGNVGTGLGALTGFITDALALGVPGNVARAAATTAGKAALARGATSKLIAQVIMPNVADAAASAVPWFLRSELQNLATGEPTALSQGALEVFKGLGIGAATDFVVGGALSSLWLFGQGARATFMRGALDKKLLQIEKGLDRFSKYADTADIPPDVFRAMNPDEQAFIKQRIKLKAHFGNGFADIKYKPLERTYHAANDLFSVFEETPSGYRIYEVPKTGKAADRLVATDFRSLSEAQDHLATRAYDYVKKVENSTGRRGIMRDEFMSHHGWLVNRIKALDESSEGFMGAMALSSSDIQDFIPKGLLKNTTEHKAYLKRFANPDRQLISRIEADAALKNGSDLFTEVHIPLKGTVVENANAGRRVFGGSAMHHTVQGEKPNALVFMGKSADDATLAKAYTTADEAIARGAKESRDELASMYLMDDGYHTVTHSDGSLTIVNPYAVKLIGTTDDARLELFTPNKMAKLAKTSASRPDAPMVSTRTAQTPTEVLKKASRIEPKKTAFDGMPERLKATFKDIDIDEDMAKIELETQGYATKGIIAPDKEILSVFVRQFDHKLGISTWRRFKSYKDAMQELGVEPQKLPAKLAPKENLVTNAREVTYDNDILKGVQADIMKMYSRFHDYTENLTRTSIMQFKKGTISKAANGDFLVELPSLGIRHTFDTIAEARQFAEGGYRRLKHLRPMATKRGLDIRVKQGKWIFNDGKQDYIANNIAELEELLKRFPDGESGAPSIFASLDPSIDQATGALVARSKIANKIAAPLEFNSTLPFWRQMPKLENVEAAVKWHRGASQIGGATVGYLEGLGRDLKEPFFAQHIRKVKQRFQLIDRDTSALRDTITKTFADEGGKKLIKDERRQAIYYWMQMQDALKNTTDDARKAKAVSDFTENWGRLSDHELRTVEKINDIMNDLSGRFGIRSHTLIFDYLPRLRKAAKDATLDPTLTNAMDFSKKVFQTDSVPHEVKFWAEHTRTQDFLDFDSIDDPMEALLSYASQGTKKLYLNSVWREFDEFLRVNKTAIPNDMKLYFNNLRERMMGTFYSPMERQVSDLLGRTFAKLTTDPKKAVNYQRAGRNMYNSLLRLNIMANMWFRPWSAMRNSMQIIQTLGARFGFDDMYKAVDDVMKNPEPVYRRLMERGVITGSSPDIQSLKNSNSFWKLFGINMDNAYEAGMKWFRNADEYTRVVAYRQGEMMFDNAYTTYKATKDSKRFLEDSGMGLIDPAYHKEAIAGIEGGREEVIAAIRHNYANIVQQDTMFGYHGWETAQAYSGLVGKAFGQYGTYSVAFRNNIFAAIRNGTKAQKAAFVARYLASNALVWTGLAAIGINAPDFIPLQPLFFSGGPLFDLGVDVLRAGDTGWEGDQARQRIASTLPRLVPVIGPLGHNIARSANLAGEHGYLSYLALGGVPLRNQAFSGSTVLWDADKSPVAKMLR